MFKILNSDEWQFVTDQEVLATDLDPTSGSGIEMILYSDKRVTVSLHGPDGILPLANGREIKISEKTLGFDQLVINGPATNSYAVQTFITNNLVDEENDGQMAVLQVPPSENQLLDMEVQKQLIAQLLRSGFQPDDVTDILDGLNEADDLDFEDDFDMPTEAEMHEMILEAQQRASQASPDDPQDVNSDPSATTPPESQEDPSEDDTA